MAQWGAFGFGLVLGWLVYFTNRYRKGDVQFSDLITLVGIIGGGAVTALFGEAKTALFGAYGLGLAVGFFAYFAMLIVMVNRSNGIFTATWFLDGRRKRLADDEEIFGDTRPTIAPMDLRFSDSLQPTVASTAMTVFTRTPLAVAIEERDRTIAVIVDAQRDLMRQISDTTNDAETARLKETNEQLIQKHDELVALRLKDVLDSEAVRSVLAKLSIVTANLVSEAQEMKVITHKLTAAKKVINQATKVIGFLGAIFA